MKNPLLFYQQEKENFEQQLATLNSKLSSIRFFRFIVFLSTAFAIYTFFENRIVMIISAVLGIIVFIWLVLKYINFQRKKQIVEARIEINSVEISVLNGNFSKLENGKEFSNSNHFYSNDIDLFGDGSLFQYINRTETLQGKSNLAKTLLANKIDGILERQNAIKELDEKVNFRQHFSALASLNIVKKSTDSVSKWIKNYSNVFPVYLSKIPLLFSGISLLIVGLISFGVIQFSILVIWFFIGLFVIFKQYYQLLQQIENENFITKNLKEKQEIITLEQKKASNIFKEFSKILDAFDNRNNDIIAVVGNGLFLMEIKNACKVEKWISNYKHTVEKWFDVVAFFDAQNSLANFNFNHPNYTFPVLNRAKNIIKSESLGHPLLNFEKRIDNDFTIEKEQFFIVTGANMAGKSTFLRTVSLTIVMANIGLPVCAKKMEYNPIKLITSMRTSDSLAEEESYFYAELKRLKFIVDKIASEEYFIILDEILKGTNSKDKAIGSKKFVEKLSNSNSTGIIATHDLSLCVLEDEFKNIENYFFDAEINEDELYFDYTLKKGICKNMNASFLLKKMEII